MPRKGHEQDAKSARLLSQEDAVRAGVQTTKLLISYRRDFAALVQSHGGPEVLRTMAKVRRRPMAPVPRRGTPTLEESLVLLAARHYLLPVGPVDPTDPDDGVNDASLLARALRPTIIALDDHELPPLSIYLGPGNWKQVWIDADASLNSIKNGLRDLGIGGPNTTRDSWSDRWGPENGFRYLILRRNGANHLLARATAFQAPKFRQESFDGCMARTWAAARRYWEWRQDQEEYERQSVS